MIGALIGAGLSAAGSIFGGVKAAKERRKQSKELAKQEQENRAWYEREYNADPTQRASAAALLNRTAEMVRSQNRNAAGRQAITGATSDAMAAQKESTARVLSNTASNIASQADARRDRVESQYRAQANNIRAQKNGLSERKAQDIATATQGVLGAAGSIATGLDSAETPKTAAVGNTGNTRVDSQIKSAILSKNQDKNTLFGREEGENWLQKKFAGL